MYVLNMFRTITSLIHIVTFHKTAQNAPTVAAGVVRHLAARMDTKNISHFYNIIKPMLGGGDKWVKSKTVRWHPQGCLVGNYKPIGKN